MTIGERLKEWRGEMSQKAAALSCGIKQPVWFRYERGDTEPAADSIRKICNFFGRSADELLGLPSRGTTVRADKGSMAVNILNNRRDGSIGPFSLTSDPPPSCKKCPHLKKLKALEKLIAK